MQIQSDEPVGTTNLAFIPARGGSKGIPNKNLRQIAGLPLIAWSIKSALASVSVDRVIVSTDSKEIASIALQFGAEVPFLRPAAISSDESSTEQALLHCLDWCEKDGNWFPQNVILLQPTSPNRSRGAIDASYEHFVRGGFDLLLSVVPSWHFNWKYDNDGAALPLYDIQNRPRRQDVTNSQLNYVENGSIYISNAKGLRKNNNRLFGRIGLFVMNENEKFEIDTHLDELLLDTIMQNKQG